MKTRPITRIFIVGLLLLGLSARADSSGQANSEWPFQTELRVMTFNLYVGANLSKLLTAKSLEEIPVLVAQAYQEISETNFTLRARALAEAVERGDPDLIGLQELSLIRRQSPGDFLIGNLTAATDVDLDYLQIFMDALEARGLEYEVVSVIHELDVELPVLVDSGAVVPELDDIRFTDRAAILKRVGIETRDVQEGNFSNNLVVSVIGVQIALTRGYNSVVAKVRGREYRFVNVHLEGDGDFFSRAIQTTQASELVELLETERELPVILMGDFNSPPRSGRTSPYQKLAAAGFVDTWTQRSYAFNDRHGYTCCQGHELTNGESELTERVDQIWVRLPGEDSRTDSSGQIGYTRVSLLGNSPEEMIQGLWPSVHAGVLARLRIPGAAGE